MHPSSANAERYVRIERTAAARGVSIHRGSDEVLEREVTLVVIDEAEAGRPLPDVLRSSARRAERLGTEVYDATADTLVIRPVDAHEAAGLLAELMPVERPGGPHLTHEPAPPGRTRRAVGLAATSALLLLLAGLLSLPVGDDRGAMAGELPAVMGVPTEPTDASEISAAALEELRIERAAAAPEPEPRPGPGPGPGGASASDPASTSSSPAAPGSEPEADAPADRPAAGEEPGPPAHAAAQSGRDGGPGGSAAGAEGDAPERGRATDRSGPKDDVTHGGGGAGADAPGGSGSRGPKP